MFDTDSAVKLAKARQQTFLQEAAAYQLLKEARAGSPGLVERLRLWLGNFLIRVGLWVKGANQQLDENEHPGWRPVY